MFTGAGMASTFLAPVVLGLYWRRATYGGALAALLGGFLAVLTLYVLGWMQIGKPSQAEHVATFFAPLASDGPLSSAAFAGAVRTFARVGPATEPFAPVYLFGLDPTIHGLVLSFMLGILVSLFTQTLPQKHVDRYFLEPSRSP
jgi:Na+/proline symporter